MLTDSIGPRSVSACAPKIIIIFLIFLANVLVLCTQVIMLSVVSHSSTLHEVKACVFNVQSFFKVAAVRTAQVLPDFQDITVKTLQSK